MTATAKKTQPVQPYTCDLDYLEAELQWIEVRCQRIGIDLRLLSQAQVSNRRVRFDTSGADNSPQALLGRRSQMEGMERDMRSQIDARRAETTRQGEAVALDRLCEQFGLDTFERTALLLCAAPCFSRRFDDHYALLEPDEHHSGAPTIEIVCTFNECGFAERIRRRTVFSSTAPLLANDLVSVDLRDRYSDPEDLLSAAVKLNSLTFNYLLGRDALGDEFLEFSSIEEPRATLDQVVLADEEKQRILSVVSNHDQYLDCRAAWGFDDCIRYGRGVLMLFYGPPGTGKTLTAHGVADALGKRVLNVDIPTFIQGNQADRFLPALFREARLRGAVLFFDECEALFGDRRHGNTLMTLLLTEIERFEGVAILATNLPEDLDPALNRRILVKVPFPEPDRSARLEIWRRHLPSSAPLSKDVDVEALADRYELTGGTIKNAVLTAVATAVHEEGDSASITMAHLEAAARQQMRKPCDEESDLLYPTVRLDCVVLPDAIRATIDEIIDCARNRRTVLERWGVGSHLSYGSGVSVLLHGTPGTGKTLCTEAIASELNRPLLLASVPALISCWVGQTERNMVQLFRDAKANGAVLLLDEADALLAERGGPQSNAHDDRTVNVLLQLIERHDGLVLLTTNLPDKLDNALTRRLSYHIEFPFPRAQERAGIWRILLPEAVPMDAGVDLDALAQEFAISGGHIKNAVFKAAFRAASQDQPVTQALLREAACEEQQAQQGPMGRPAGF